MILRYSTNDIFWNKDNEIKPNKNAFNSYINAMQTTSNFNVNWLDELNIKITIPINNLWKFIEIDDEKNTKFSKRYYYLSSILSKNKVNCECIFTVDVWTTFILNNFDKFFSNRTNDINQPINPFVNEVLIPKTNRKKYKWSVKSKNNLTTTYHPNIDDYPLQEFINTHMIHVFYADHYNNYVFLFNPNWGCIGYNPHTGQTGRFGTYTSAEFETIIGKSMNLVLENKPLKYVASYIAPNYNHFETRTIIRAFDAGTPFDEKVRLFKEFNQHIQGEDDTFWNGHLPNFYYGLKDIKEVIDVFKDNNYIKKLSNCETDYLGISVNSLSIPFEMQMYDVLCIVNNNYVFNVKTRYPYIQDSYLQTIKQNAASYNTSLSIAEQTFKLQSDKAISKGVMSIFESATMGPLNAAMGFFSGNAKQVAGGIREGIFGTANNINDMIFGLKGAEQQYKNTLERAKAQRADIQYNSTSSITTYDSNMLNYTGFKSIIQEGDVSTDIMYYYGDDTQIDKVFEFYGFNCIPYEINNVDDLNTYIRCYADWLDINTNYYKGLTIGEITAIKLLLIQGVRVSNG